MSKYNLDRFPAPGESSQPLKEETVKKEGQPPPQLPKALPIFSRPPCLSWSDYIVDVESPIVKSPRKGNLYDNGNGVPVGISTAPPPISLSTPKLPVRASPKTVTPPKLLRSPSTTPPRLKMSQPAPLPPSPVVTSTPPLVPTTPSKDQGIQSQGQEQDPMEEPLEDIMLRCMVETGFYPKIKGEIAKFIFDQGKSARAFAKERADADILGKIYEYLQWVGMKSTAAVLLSESPVTIQRDQEKMPKDHADAPVPKLVKLLQPQPQENFGESSENANERKSEPELSTSDILSLDTDRDNTQDISVSSAKGMSECDYLVSLNNI